MKIEITTYADRSELSAYGLTVIVREAHSRPGKYIVTSVKDGERRVTSYHETHNDAFVAAVGILRRRGER
jgi:hypothetical protein